MSIKVLSVRQPWATAILEYGKNIENRTWQHNYRGILYIHASKSRHKSDFDSFRQLTKIQMFASSSPLPSGILGYVDLVDIVSNSDSPWAMPDNFHWVLKNPRKFKEPVECLGQLGLWTPSYMVQEKVKKARDLLWNYDPEKAEERYQKSLREEFALDYIDLFEFSK